MLTEELERPALANMAGWWTAVAQSRGGRVRVDEHGTHVDAAGPNGVMNRSVAVRSGVPAAELATAAHAHFAEGPGGPYSVFDPGQRRDLSDHGYQWLASLPHMALAGHREPALPVRRATTAEDVAVAEALVRTSFTFAGWDATPFLSCVLTDSRAQLFLSTDGAASAIGFDAAGVTGVYLVATDPASRGRGLGEAVTWAAGGIVPGQVAVLQASAMGAPVYRRMGYEEFGTVTVWLADR